MSGSDLSVFLYKIAVGAVPILLAITVHEVAHGRMARHFGDRTAEMLGRLTLNPIRHIDPVGTVLVPLLTLWFGNFLFGWAKPVPIGYRNLSNPKRDMVAIALAGPGANLAMAIGWALLLQLVLGARQSLGSSAIYFKDVAQVGIFINVLLMLINLVPIPPLDGGRVLRGLVPEPFGRQLDALERYGLIIVVGLLMLGLLDPVFKLVWRISAFLGA